MKYIDWDERKNNLLKLERDVCFEEVLVAIESGGLIKTIRHPRKERYPNQKIFVVNINNYAYLVPFIEDKEKIFLKTIIPSRKATKKYIVKGGEK